MFEYKEFKISEFRFIRTIQDQRYTFENNKLISTEILSASGQVTIFDNINPIYGIYDQPSNINQKNSFLYLVLKKK